MLSVYIVDDEPAARDMLAYFIDREENFSFHGMTGDPLEAIEEINQLKPDIVLLDIQMPELNGIELLPYLKHHPLIIFCTAYDAYALEAFRVKAIDYLLKPISEKQLNAALVRAQQEWDKLLALKLSSVQKQGLSRIVCSRGRDYDIVWLTDVWCFYKQDGYLHIIDKEGVEHMSELSINYIEEQSSQGDFFRINRSQIIRRDIIRSFSSKLSGALELETTLDQDPILKEKYASVLPFRVSRRRTNEFRKWLSDQAKR